MAMTADTQPLRRAWTTPRLQIAEISDLTRSGEGSGVDSGTMIGMSMVSDARLKSEITACGVTEGGVPLFAFRYLGGGPLHVGMLAQVAMRFVPEAVLQDEIGVLRVDYTRIGVEPVVIPI